MCQLGEISFANRIAYNIKVDDVKKYILDELETKFNFKVIQKHYEKYTDTSISKLNNNPHLISVRTNGNPYLLYLTKLNFVNQCIFIDKKIQSGYYYPRMIISKFRFDNDLFDGTLLDGEMIKDKDGYWIFLINDIIAYKNRYLENVNLVRRVNLLYKTLGDEYIKDDYDVCLFQVKKYFTYDQLGYIIDVFVPSLKYTCRGIYFKPLFLKFKDILMNFDDTLIQKVMRKKYKSVSSFLLMEDKERLIVENSKVSNHPNKEMDKKEKEKNFIVRKTINPDVYTLHEIESGISEKNELTACIATLKISKMMRAIFYDKNITDKVVMLCEYSDKFGKWIPKNVVG
jgi:hypothetical protein